MKSKALLALGLVAAVTVMICCTFSYRFEWWAFIDAFCLFMASFMHLLATLQPPALSVAARKIDLIAKAFAAVGVIALIGEVIAYLCIYV